jgi:hypothetical protein
MRDQSLTPLLLLGEPEAVVAVAHAPGLTEQQARCAWWALPESEIARKMLAKPNVAQSELGKELARYLIDYLPFETEPHDIVDSVRLVLQPGLIDAATRDSLWKKAGRKSAYYVGFLFAMPDELPEAAKPHPLWKDVKVPWTELSERGNAVAGLMLRLIGENGQRFLGTVEKAMDKVANQEVMVMLLGAIAAYCQEMWPSPVAKCRCRTGEDIEAYTQSLMGEEGRKDIHDVLTVSPEVRPQLTAAIHMALVGEPLVDPVFSQTDAIGSLMRKKLRPVTDWLRQNINQLTG